MIALAHSLIAAIAVGVSGGPPWAVMLAALCGYILGQILMIKERIG